MTRDRKPPAADLVPLREAAVRLGYPDTERGRRAAEAALRRAGIRSGYHLAAVEWLRDNRPGSGARTDRRREQGGSHE